MSEEEKYEWRCFKCSSGFLSKTPPMECLLCKCEKFFKAKTFLSNVDGTISPSHYKGDKFECIDIAETMSFNRGNALKYIWRAGKKSKETLIEDLKKAQWYIAREIERLSGESK